MTFDHTPKVKRRQRRFLGADSGSLLEGGLERVGYSLFGNGKAIDAGGEAWPLGPFEGKEEFVDVVMAIVTAGEGSLDFLIDGEGAEDLGDGLVEESIGDGEQAHEEEAGALVIHMGGMGQGFTEIGAGESSPDEFGRLAGGEGDDGEDGDPTSKFPFTEEHKGMADTMDFGAQAEERGVEIAEKTVEKRRLVLKEFFDGSVIELGARH